MSRKTAAGRPASATPAKRAPARAKPGSAKGGKGGKSGKDRKPTGKAAARSGKAAALRRIPASKAAARKTKVKTKVREQAAIRALKAELADAKARIDALQAWADTDFLLDILNRRGFERELIRAVAYIKRYRATGALVVLDVDRLKPINDTFGHAAGDAVLKGIVAVLMRHVRSSDVVGRLGGDEFGLLLWNLSEADALAKAAALEDAIDRLTFVFRGRATTAGASTGIAMLAPDVEAAAALEQADQAMYARKLVRKSTTAAPVRVRR